LQALRHQLSDMESQLQQELQAHGATRAQHLKVTTALDRKVTALQSLEAEKDRLVVSLKNSEEMVKELTLSKLEGTALDAVANKAQYMNEVCQINCCIMLACLQSSESSMHLTG
jgi:hypothetical protein